MDGNEGKIRLESQQAENGLNYVFLACFDKIKRCCFQSELDSSKASARIPRARNPRARNPRGHVNYWYSSGLKRKRGSY